MSQLKRSVVILFLTLFFLGPLLALAAEKKDEPTILVPLEDVELTAELDNPFSLVVNGQQTRTKISFNNKGQENYTIQYVVGQLISPDDSTNVVRNLTVQRYEYLVPSMDHGEIIYGFYSELRPQDLDLVIYIQYADEKNNQYQGVAYNATIHIVEPEQSLFDLQLLFLYAILLSAMGGIGYMIYQAFIGGAKSKSKKRAQAAADKQAAAATIELTEYDESWIPNHNLKARGSSKNKKKEEKSENSEKSE